MASKEGLTRQATAFIESCEFDQLPADAIRVGRRCILDGLGLMVAGAEEPAVQILKRDALDQAGKPEALLLGAGKSRVPASMAGRVLGTAGHSHDWDDTQVSRDPRHVYGLLTHPTIPPLAAAIVVSQKLGGVDGRAFTTAFHVGFEIECKISELMTSEHYRRGHHSSGTVGTFGACAAAAKLMKLSGLKLRHALGIAASFSAGIRTNFGTMTKPLHVGRAVENGVIAASLANSGFTADPDVLDGRWGFFSVMGGGLYGEKVMQGVGEELNILNPGVSIKPYPSGILTHQAMDAMLALVCEHDLHEGQIKKIRFFAGANILEPIRYRLAKNYLEAKFSMPALMAMIVLKRRASHREFTDAFILSEDMQRLQNKIDVLQDRIIDSMGYDKIRSRIEVETYNGRTLTKWADENYRGGPDNPISDDELIKNFAFVQKGILTPGRKMRS